MGKNDEALAIAARINKEVGGDALMIASGMHVPVRFTSSSLSLDAALGGGWPGNQWVEIYGPENHGKTVIALKTVAANQRKDPDFYTLWVASEHYDLDQAKAMGVDTDRVMVLHTRDMAFAYDTVLEYLEARACDMVVIDSYPALVAPDEDTKKMENEPTMSEGAKLTNRFFRKVGKAGLRDAYDPNDRPWLGIFINQPREKPGAWSPSGGVVETTPGGRGKNFAFYCRLKVQRTEFLKAGAAKVGIVIKCQTIKNKGGPPERVAFLDFYFTDAPNFPRGSWDDAKDVLTTAIIFEVVRQGGSWYKFEDLKWQGSKQIYDALRADPALLRRVDEATRTALANPRDKRTYDDDAVAAATTTTVRRRRKRSDED